MSVSFQDISDQYNGHIRDWSDVIREFEESRGTSSEACDWLRNRKHMPSLETIKYEPDPNRLGYWVEVPDPNPDQTEKFRRYYLPTQSNDQVPNSDGLAVDHLLRSPLPIFALQRYTQICSGELNSTLTKDGFSASHIIHRFNTGMFPYLESVGLVSQKINVDWSALVGRVLNHIHGSQGWLYNCRERGMKFFVEPLFGKYEIAQNRRYIKIKGRTIQIARKLDYPRWHQFYQVSFPKSDPDSPILLGGYGGQTADIYFSSKMELVDYFYDLPGA